MWKGCEGFFDDEDEYGGPDYIEEADPLPVLKNLQSLIAQGSVWAEATSEQIMGDMRDWMRVMSRPRIQGTPPTPTNSYHVYGHNMTRGFYDEATKNQAVQHFNWSDEKQDPGVVNVMPDPATGAYTSVPGAGGAVKVYYKGDDGKLHLLGDAKDFNLSDIKFTDNESDSNRD